MHWFRSVLLIVIVFFSMTANGEYSQHQDEPTLTELQEAKASFKRPSSVTFPKSKPYSPHKVMLGKMLFFDARLSGIMNMSCASCHNPSFGWKMPINHTVGANGIKLPRSAPTLYGLHESPTLFRDGRATSLEHQATMPLKNQLEMDSSIDLAVERLTRIETYKQLFSSVFPNRSINESTISEAIAAFERTIQAGWAPFDSWVNGDDSAITQDAKKGFELFIGKAGCSACHSGWQFSDFKFHDIGLEMNDLGRYAVDPSSEKNKYAFKTPTLRNISSRAPYMSNGGIESVHEVVEFYSRKVIQRDSLPEGFGALGLTSKEISVIVAFLKTLDQETQSFKMPNLPVD